MERDLFWHSVCHKHNSRNSRGTDHKDKDREKEEKKESPVDGNSDQHTS